MRRAQVGMPLRGQLRVQLVAARAGCLVYDPDALVDDARCEIAPQGDERLVPPWAR